MAHSRDILDRFDVAHPHRTLPSVRPDKDSSAFPDMHARRDSDARLTPSDADDFARLSLLDAHCHLGLMENGLEVARDAQALGLSMLSMGVRPSDYPAEQSMYAPFSNISVGLGLHPWYVNPLDWHTQADTVVSRLPQAEIVGEVGLDFSPAHARTSDAQHSALKTILRACAKHGDLIISLHAVRSAETVLGLLEQTGAARTCVCIFHWFSGSSDDLQRALRIGALFSIGERMLATRRGRAYAQTIPRSRILLETDAPEKPRTACVAADIASNLHRCGLRATSLTI